MTRHPLIVPDVNVLVSGAVLSNHAPSLIIEAWKDGLINVATSELILSDLRRVFTYPRVLKLTQMTHQEIDAYIRTIAEGAILVRSAKSVAVSTDPDDDKLFACALKAQADYLVSMDKQHVLPVGEYHGIPTIHPTDFVRDVLELKRAA